MPQRESTLHLCLISSYFSDGRDRTKWEKRVVAYVKPPTGVTRAQIILLTVVAAIAIIWACVSRISDRGLSERTREGERDWKEGEWWEESVQLYRHACTESPCE